MGRRGTLSGGPEAQEGDRKRYSDGIIEPKKKVNGEWGNNAFCRKKSRQGLREERKSPGVGPGLRTSL